MEEGEINDFVAMLLVLVSSPLRMTGCWVELQLENTVLDLPLSDLTTIHCYRGHPLLGAQLHYSVTPTWTP